MPEPISPQPNTPTFFISIRCSFYDFSVSVW
jgi:hypothetical protein